MINLLPPEYKKQIRAAQTNTLLLRYIITSIMLALLLLGIIVGVYVIMSNSKKSAEETIRDSQARSASYQKIDKEATEFSKNLQTAKTILGKEVRYSKIAVKIAQALPSGVVLENLQLDAKTFGQPTVFNAKGKNYNDAIRLKTAFEKSDLFEDVHLQSITSGEEGGVSISVSASINPEVANS